MRDQIYRYFLGDQFVGTGCQEDRSEGSSHRPTTWHKGKSLYHNLCQATASEKYSSSIIMSGRNWGLRCYELQGNCRSWPGCSKCEKRLDRGGMNGSSQQSPKARLGCFHGLSVKDSWFDSHISPQVGGGGCVKVSFDPLDH